MSNSILGYSAIVSEKSHFNWTIYILTAQNMNIQFER